MKRTSLQRKTSLADDLAKQFPYMFYTQRRGISGFYDELDKTMVGIVDHVIREAARIAGEYDECSENPCGVIIRDRILKLLSK